MPGRSEEQQEARREMLRRKIAGLGERSMRKSYYPELQRRLEELRESEARYHAVFESVNDAILVIDAETGNIVDLNGRVEEVVRIPRERLLGSEVYRLGAGIPPYTKEVARARIARAAAGEVQLFEWQAANVDGSPLWVEVGLRPFDFAGEPHVVAVIREVTHWKTAERELRMARDLVTQILDNIPQAVFWKDRAGRYLGCNAVFARDVGVGRPEEVVGRTDFDMPWPREEAEAYLADDHDVMENGHPRLHIIEPLQQADGTRLWVDTSKVPLRDQAGNVFGLLGVYEDITERKRTEEAVVESEARFRSVVESSPMGMHFYSLEEDTRLVFYGANAAADRILGVDHRQFVGKTIEEAFPNLASIEVPARYRTLAREGGDWQTEYIEYNDRKISGAYEVHAFQVAPGSMAAMFSDVSERLQGEQERERLMSAIEQAAEVIVITDVSGTIQYVNPAFTVVTGYTRDEALGQNPRILKSGQHDPAFYRQMWETLERGETWSGTMVNKRKNGSLFVEEAVVSPVRNAAGQTVNYVAVKRDVTGERKLEEQLRQAQKMEAIGQLAGGIAHDFNNMLGVILGHAQMALSELDSNHPLYEDLHEIETAARRSADLTRQLLAFARRQTVSPRVLDLNATLAGMLKMIKRLIGEDIELQFAPGQNLWAIRIDPSQVDQILANLCVNARDAIDGVGKVTIETCNTRLDESYCDEHAGFVPGDYVQLAVSDNGCGLDEERLARVFEPFFTTKPQGEGTGLGLATVYGIVKQNRGFINAYSELNHGTTFKIYLPRHAGQASHKAEQPDNLISATGDETVLLVEDQPALLEMTRAMLQRLGYHVLAAATPRQAIAVAEAHTEPVHLLLTDVVMPEMNGRELARHLGGLCPGLACLYVSGYTANVIARHGVLDEGVHFLAKPFSLQGLADKVREVLDEAKEQT